MFTAQQQAIIDTGAYSKCFNISFTGLSGSNAIRWTTLPYDYGDFQSENFLLSLSNITTTTGKKDQPVDITIAGSISMVSAFSECLGAEIEVQIGIYSDPTLVYFNPVFSGVITKYGVKRGLTSVQLTLEAKDKINALNMTNSRLLTKEDQLRRVPGDQCLEFMGQSTTATFWGKEV